MEAAGLDGQVALVAGATRGAGRAIARELAAAGATVVVTGRTSRSARSGGPSRSHMGRPETIEETADLITAAGGEGVARVVDHTVVSEVASLVAWIGETYSRLDILVNDIWGGDPLTTWGVPFWKHPLDDGLLMQRLAVETHLITSWHAVPLMIESGGRLVVEITDGVEPTYRGSLFYDLAKASVIRLAVGQAADFASSAASSGLAAVAVSPGFLRSESMLDHFGVTEETWRDAVAKDPHFAASETPHFVGRGIAALAADPDVLRFSGRALGSWELGDEYGVTDLDGSRPHWGRYAAENLSLF